MNILIEIRSCFLSLVLIILLFPANMSAADKDLPAHMSSHLKKQYTDDLGELLEKRYLRVLTTFNKTNFYISGSKFYGFEYSLLKEYEKFLNKQIRRRDLKLVIEFIPVSRDQLIPALTAGYGDIAAAGLTITTERLKKISFTDPYLTGIDEVIVANKKVAHIDSLEDLSGEKVFVRQSSSYYESLVLLNKELRKKKKRPVIIVRADEDLETEDILELVNSGAIKITVADHHIARIWSGFLSDLRVLDHLKVRQGGRIAWMVRKNNPVLKDNINKFIRNHRKGTLLGNIYFNRYYRNTKWIKNPLSAKENKRLHTYKKLFKKYSRQYGFDWIMIMAQAFQESELDNSRKSAAGAVGIMQIKPSTAMDKHVAIKNIHLPENNIHAGIKYLAFLRDRYFNDKDIRERDRMRLTLAAYNAGPNKIRKIRDSAKKMGMDPDRWFRNTEFAALKYIGQETVRYVSNINQYYLIFRAAFEKERERESEINKILGD